MVNGPDPEAEKFIEPSLSAAEGLLHERDYEAAERVLRGCLPTIPQTAYAARVKWYSLIFLFPKGRFSEEGRENALEASSYVIDHKKEFGPEVQLLAHVVYHALERSGVPARERRELLALEAAQRVLQEDGEEKVRNLALLLTAWESPEQEEAEVCFAELCEKGDNFSLMLACSEKENEFHRRTQLAYLERAIARFWHTQPLYASHLLVRKMSVLIEDLAHCDLDDEKEVLRLRAGLLMCHVNLQSIAENFPDRACAEYYLGCAANEWGSDAMAQFHLEAAMCLAEQFDTRRIGEAAEELRDTILKSRNDGEEGG